MLPDLLKLIVELLVFGYSPELATVGRVFLQSPVRRGRDHQMNGFILDPAEFAGVAAVHKVRCPSRSCGRGGSGCHHSE